MTRLRLLVSCAAIALALSTSSCGSNGSSDPKTEPKNDASVAVTAASVVPKTGEVPDWTIDPDNEKTAHVAAATGTTADAVEGLIDGAAADFFDGFTPVQFAWQNYVNTKVPAKDAPNGATLALYVLEMPDSSEASGVYAHLLTANLYAKYTTWVDPSSPLIGDKSRIVDTGDHWWINFYKGKFYVEVNLLPSAGPAPDYTQGLTSTRDAAIAFAKAIAAKL